MGRPGRRGQVGGCSQRTSLRGEGGLPCGGGDGGLRSSQCVACLGTGDSPEVEQAG